MPKKSTAKKTKRASKKSSALQRVKSAKRKLTALYTVLSIVAFVALLGFGFYLGSKESNSIASRETDKPSRIFKQLDSTASKGEGIKVSYDEAGFDPPDIIGRLIKKQEERSKARREQERQAAEKEHPKASLVKGKKPKLVLIIDDVSQPWQIKAIRSLGLKITPSIFPPSSQSKKSHKLAKGLKHFMIHLPMQSGNAKLDQMWGTLKTTDSDSKMRARAKEIRKLFPHAKYVNNHTGSVFTSDYRAIKKMYGYLRDEGFVFIDSRTTPKSKVKRVAKEYGDRYIVRDIFIDNTRSIPYIHKQLKKAVKIAKKRGYAIAIGHPHKTTFKALAKAGGILDSVELVYIDELYR